MKLIFFFLPKVLHANTNQQYSHWIGGEGISDMPGKILYTKFRLRLTVLPSGEASPVLWQSDQQSGF